MENTSNYDINSFNQYYQAVLQIPSDTKNYMNKKVILLQEYGSAVYNYTTQKMQQIHHFPTRAKNFYNVLDQTAYASYRGMIIGGLIGFAVFGLPGIGIGAVHGALLGFAIGLFDSINQLVDTIKAETVTQII